MFPLARDHLSFPELLAQGFRPHKVKTVLLSNFERQNYFVDISSTLDIKQQAVAAHTSQFPDVSATRKMISAQAGEMGELAACEYAEAFVRIDIDSAL